MSQNKFVEKFLNSLFWGYKQTGVQKAIHRLNSESLWINPESLPQNDTLQRGWLLSHSPQNYERVGCYGRSWYQGAINTTLLPISIDIKSHPMPWPCHYGTLLAKVFGIYCTPTILRPYLINVNFGTPQIIRPENEHHRVRKFATK